MVVETDRLELREMTRGDLPALRLILKDAEVMYAYEHAFSEDEVQAWMDNQLRRYCEDGIGLWAIILKAEDKMIGQCGITMQPWGGGTVHEIGYHLQKAYWHNGYATEAALACREYAFTTLNLPAIHCIIRDTNKASQNVALRLGMEVIDTGIRHYMGIDMPHLLFAVRR